MEKNTTYEGKYFLKCHDIIICQVQELLQIHCVNIPSLSYTNAITVTYLGACDQAKGFKLKTVLGK